MGDLLVTVSEWTFARIEGGQRALVLPESYFFQMRALESVGGVAFFLFKEFWFKGEGTDCLEFTGRELRMKVSNVSLKQQGMAHGYALFEFINVV